MFLCMHVWLIVFPSSIMINSLQSSMILRIRKLHFHFLERSKSKLPACQVWAWFCHCGVCRWFLQVGILFFFKAKAQFFIFNNFWKSKFSIEFTFLHYIDQIIANEKLIWLISFWQVVKCWSFYFQIRINCCTTNEMKSRNLF